MLFAVISLGHAMTPICTGTCRHHRASKKQSKVQIVHWKAPTKNIKESQRCVLSLSACHINHKQAHDTSDQGASKARNEEKARKHIT